MSKHFRFADLLVETAVIEDLGYLPVAVPSLLNLDIEFRIGEITESGIRHLCVVDDNLIAARRFRGGGDQFRPFDEVLVENTDLDAGGLLQRKRDHSIGIDIGTADITRHSTVEITDQMGAIECDFAPGNALVTENDRRFFTPDFRFVPAVIQYHLNGVFGIRIEREIAGNEIRV